MSRAIAVYSSLFVVLLVIALGLRLPAAGLWGLASQTLGQSLTASAVEGTVAAGELRHGRLDTVVIDRLAWRWQPTALLFGELAVVVTATVVAPTANQPRGETVEFAIARRWATTRLTVTAAQLSWSTVKRLWPAAAALPVDGDLQFNGQGVIASWPPTAPDFWPQALAATLELAPLRLTAMNDAAIGPVQFAVQQNGAMIEITARDQGGPLALDGRLTLDSGRRYRGELLFRPRRTAPTELNQWVNFIGQPTADGGRRLDFQGRLP